MAPTEVLARQHYDNLIELIKEHNINVNPVVLVGSMTAKKKKEMLIKLSNQEMQI